MVSDTYNTASERLWEKIEFHRAAFDPLSVNWKNPFPADQLKPNDLLLKLVGEVEKECGYGMSEFQCSWAVNQAFHGKQAGIEMMKMYNDKSGTDLEPRE